MSPLERLLSEAIPIRPEPAQPWGWTRAAQDAHWQELCNAVGTPGVPRPKPPDPASE